MALKQQFKIPKSYSQIVNELKDIKQGAYESIWEADQWLKKAIREGGFQYDDRQHTEWFIAMLLPTCVCQWVIKPLSCRIRPWRFL